MLGYIHKLVEAFVLERVDESAWATILEVAAAKHGVTEPAGGWSRLTKYDDADIYGIVFAAAEVAGLEVPAVLEEFGKFFVDTVHRDGYSAMLASQGYKP
mmetsp:Transcript_43560/g.136626  ORF Transcript_43560/g.136626 Transcript_43560/m.136626 type:complete len:100 (-) Transcript_43560:1435-1734(-)